MNLDYKIKITDKVRQKLVKRMEADPNFVLILNVTEKDFRK